MASAVTTKFQTALPFALLSISPSLAALHASRARSLCPAEFDPLSITNCLQCGSYLLAADGSVELRRPRKRRKVADKKSNSIKTTCHHCGFVSYTSFDRRETFLQSKPTTAAALLSSSVSSVSVSSRSERKPKEELIPPSSRSFVPIRPSHVAHLTRGTTPDLHSKSQKKTTILQEMLARSREKEASRTKSQQKPQLSGLASFLGSLQ